RDERDRQRSQETPAVALVEDQEERGAGEQRNERRGTRELPPLHGECFALLVTARARPGRRRLRMSFHPNPGYPLGAPFPTCLAVPSRRQGPRAGPPPGSSWRWLVPARP